MKKIVVVILFAVAGFGQEQPPIRDLNLFVGKQVVVQRIPLCQPGTYTVVLTYSGKQATIVSLKPYKSPYPISQAALDKMKPELRVVVEDQLKAATILLQFEDGTQLDTCAPIGPSKFAESFELSPGQSMQNLPAQAAASPSIPAATTSTKQAADVLSDDEVKLALGGRGKDHWVQIQDMGLMAAQGNQVPTITLYMPEAVLAIRSESAKKQFVQYELSEEDKRRSLMVVAQGYAGKTIASGCTSITRVVLLSNPSGGIVKEAYLSEPLGETWRNNFGATNKCQALRAKFSLDLDDVRKVREAALNGEFIVAVFSGSIDTKMYKIKKKHESKLSLE